MIATRTTDENKKIFQKICEVFGVKKDEIRTQAFWDEKQQNYIDIAICENNPIENVTAYSTIALSDFSIGKKVNNIPLGIEMVAACATCFDKIPNILSTCAFNIIIERSSCFPGAVYPNEIDMYIPKNSLKHMFFVQPFGWDKEFETLEFPTKKVSFLLAVPISDAEFRYRIDNGPEALQEIFDERQIDIYDLNRKSIL